MTKCLISNCEGEPEFYLTRTDARDSKTIIACRNHTDYFHELVLSVKYGSWNTATVGKVTQGAPAAAK